MINNAILSWNSIKKIISSHILCNFPYSKMKIEIFNSETLSKNLFK